MANSDDLGRLAQEVANAYEERIQSISNIKRDTAAFLAETREEIEGREIQIERLLAEFNDARLKMGREVRAELAKVKPELDAAEGARKKADQAEIKERKETVRGMLDEFRKEQEETAAAWKALLAGMTSLREKVTITGPAGIEAAVEVATVDEALEEEAPEEMELGEGVTEEQAPKEMELGEDVTEEEEYEEDDLGSEIVVLLGDNPNGLRMVEIADFLGIENWRSLIPVMRQLLDEGEVTKEDSTYYAV